jgi:hypothetical protein
MCVRKCMAFVSLLILTLNAPAKHTATPGLFVSDDCKRVQDADLSSEKEREGLRAVIEAADRGDAMARMCVSVLLFQELIGDKDADVDRGIAIAKTTADESKAGTAQINYALMRLYHAFGNRENGGLEIVRVPPVRGLGLSQEAAEILRAALDAEPYLRAASANERADIRDDAKEFLQYLPKNLDQWKGVDLAPHLERYARRMARIEQDDAGTNALLERVLKGLADTYGARLQAKEDAKARAAANERVLKAQSEASSEAAERQARAAEMRAQANIAQASSAIAGVTGYAPPSAQSAQGARTNFASSKQGLRADECIKVGRDGKEMQLRNACSFDVEVAYCLKGVSNLFSCPKGGGASTLRAGSAHHLPLSEQATGLNVVACRGRAGEVLPILQRDGQAGGCN